MSSNPLSASRIHPLVATAAISVTVLSFAGIGAMTGLLPTPFAKSGESTVPFAAAPQSVATAPAALATMTERPLPGAPAEPAAPALTASPMAPAAPAVAKPRRPAPERS